MRTDLKKGVRIAGSGNMQVFWDNIPAELKKSPAGFAGSLSSAAAR